MNRVFVAAETYITVGLLMGSADMDHGHKMPLRLNVTFIFNKDQT